MVDPLPGRQGGAKAQLFTILGEFVLPSGGSAWTSTLVAASETLGIAEKNARQAIARVADQHIIEARRAGRAVRWTLTERGRRLLETGAQRIYEFGSSSADWNGEWLVAHCPVPEAQRALRHELRTDLAFEGFGELAASLVISPHVEREPGLRRILDRIGLLDDSVVLRSRTGSHDEDADIVRRAWDLDVLAAAYQAFVDRYDRVAVGDRRDQFTATVRLVHDWRRFPFTDPELPTSLLPDRWAGTTAADLFGERRQRWAEGARAWFDEQEASNPAAVKLP